VWLGLGANLGDRLANLRAALRRVERVVAIDAVSSVYESEPVGYQEQPDFLNLVVRGRTTLSPRALLEAVLGIERELGRERAFPNSPRVIDIDLLLYGDRVIAEPGLQVPHPRMLERAFVLRPLVEIDPDLPHPLTGERMAGHLAGADRLESCAAVLTSRSLLNSMTDG